MTAPCQLLRPDNIIYLWLPLPLISLNFPSPRDFLPNATLLVISPKAISCLFLKVACIEVARAFVTLLPGVGEKKEGGGGDNEFAVLFRRKINNK